MKKSVLYLCAGILVLGLTACGGKPEESGASGSGSSESSSQGTEQTDVSGSGETPESTGTEDSEGSGAENGQPGADGWSEEMAGLRGAVVEALTEDEYWPDMAMDPDMLEGFYGITADMYDDYMAESPMVSNNVDTLIIVKAKEGQADAVFDKLTAYREVLVNDTMQYPGNLGKIQGSQVEKIGNYVVFVQLGGYAGMVEEDEEEAIAKSQEANNKALDAIRGKLE